MSRYIDADKLIAEIERQLTSINRRPLEMRGDYVEGLIDSFNRTITFITSLQQDETQVDKMLCSQIWWEEQGWIMIPPDVTIKGIDSLLKQIKKKLQQEQPEVDLEKELDQWRHKHFKGKRDDDYSGEYLERESQLDLARHFYELGLNARKEE